MRMSASGAADGVPKQFMILAGLPVLAHSIRTFGAVAPEVDIVVALPADHLRTWASLCREYDVPPHKTCVGGATRFLSVRNAMENLDPDCELIAVHDGARPLVSPALIRRTVEIARRHGTAIPAIPVNDTVRRIGLEGVSHPEDRATLRAVQTPQVFRVDILRDAYAKASDGMTENENRNKGEGGGDRDGSGKKFTDDGSVVEAAGYDLTLCEGERRNIKITEPADMAIAGALMC